MKLVLTYFLLITAVLSTEKLKVVAVTPDIASITKEIGGDYVAVSTLMAPRENPHKFRPSEKHLELVDAAGLFIINGLELEALWLEDFLKKSNNSIVKIDQPGFLDPSKIIKPIVLSKGAFTRLSGRGSVKVNPHYLLDPVNGILAAQMINSSLKRLVPEQSSYFNSRLEVFQMKLLTRVIGVKGASEYKGEISRLIKINQFLKVIDKAYTNPATGGWLKELKPGESGFLVDHQTYSYLLQRFSLKTADAIEQFPGFPPSSRHVNKIISERTSQNTAALLTCFWFDSKVISRIADKTSIPVIKLAHQTGSLQGCETYLKTMDSNFKKLTELLSNQPAKHE